VRFIGLIAAGLILGGLACAHPSWAAEAQEAAPEWRQWWDLAWRIANFLILAFLIVKMAKQPLKDFLGKQRNEVAEELKALEDAKQQAIAEREQWEAKTRGLAEELSKYEKALADMAANERERMLNDARKESDRIMERARIWADQYLRRAKMRLADDILDLAAKIAGDKIQAGITPEDRAKLLADFTEKVKNTRAA
jgi:F-type H+-transporting ATPase subunit b